MIELLTRFVCEYVAMHCRQRTIAGADGSPYLTKYTLYDGRGESDEDGKRDGFAAHLHRFHRGDEDDEYHDHPWTWGVSLVLTTGYVETYLVDRRGMRVYSHWLKPWRLNFLRGDSWHRVDLPPGAEAFTLFVSGPVVKSWGFMNPVTGETMPWLDFLKTKGVAPHEARRQRKVAAP